MMNSESYATEIADGLSAIHRREGSAQFFVVLLREFAEGKAVSRQTLRTALGWPDASDTAMLGGMPDIEYDDRAISSAMASRLTTYRTRSRLTVTHSFRAMPS